MSEGNATPGEWRPGQGEPQSSQGGPGAVQPPQGGFGPPPAWYGPAAGPPQGDPGGYGYPQPAHPGYGYPPADQPRSEVPATFGDGASGAPDWSAMADAHERGRRRKRLVRIGVGLVAALALAGIVTVAVLHGGGKKPAADHQANPAPTAPGSQGPCTPPTAGAPATAGSSDATLGPAAQAGPVDGHTGPALTLHGQPDGYAESDSVVLNTCASFTVSAVVRNDAPTGGRAVVSQGGDGFFSYYLGRDYWGSHNQWVFKVQTAAADGSSREALSTDPATTGQWTTLTGVYDAQDKTISLYVDGVLAQTTPVPGILSTSGPLEIGRARFKSKWVDSWSGAIADVQIWERPLAPDIVAQLARTRSADVGPHASWYRY